MDRMLTAAEAAWVLGKKPSWLAWARRERLIAFHRVGTQVRYSERDLCEWLAKQRVPAKDEYATSEERKSLVGLSENELFKSEPSSPLVDCHHEAPKRRGLR
jgi:hypothetical protein